MTAAWYTTREAVTGALDVKLTARMNRLVDEAIAAQTPKIDEAMNRSFYPLVATREFPWPNDQNARPWRLWLDNTELISVDTLTSAGVTIPSSDYFLEPQRTGPPYTHVEIDLASPSSFGGGNTPQRNIAITGLWGYRNDEETVGTLAALLGSSASSTANVTWSTARIGVGDILRIDSERMIVTARTWVDSGQNLGGSGLAANVADVTVPVSSGSAYAADEILLIDSERMLVVDVAGNNLTVKRAWDGSTLAAHTAGADIYALTGVELARGQLGTVAASHAADAVIYRFVVPPLIAELAEAEAIVAVQQKTGAYARTQGSGDNQRPAPGGDLEDIRTRAWNAHARKMRHRAV